MAVRKKTSPRAPPAGAIRVDFGAVAVVFASKIFTIEEFVVYLQAVFGKTTKTKQNK